MNCRFCGGYYKNSNSTRSHERFCKMNPNREISPFVEVNRLGKNVWNKGLTKDIDSRLLKQSQTPSNNIKEGKVKKDS